MVPLPPRPEHVDPRVVHKEYGISGRGGSGHDATHPPVRRVVNVDLQFSPKVVVLAVPLIHLHLRLGRQRTRPQCPVQSPWLIELPQETLRPQRVRWASVDRRIPVWKRDAGVVRLQRDFKTADELAVPWQEV
jgi:hypothetical protein